MVSMISGLVPAISNTLSWILRITLAAVLLGRITGLARPSQSVPHGHLQFRKQYSVKKTRIVANFSREKN